MTDINETKQRFLTLSVGEVSLVDHPANQEEWLVIKRLGGNQMLEETTNPEITQPPEIAEDEKADQVVEKAVEAKDETVKEETVETKTEKVEESVKAEKEVETEKALSPENAVKILTQFWNSLKPYFAGGNFPEPKKTTKSLLAIQDGELVINTNLVKEIQDVEKGHKMFTSTRVDKISEAVKVMIGLLKDVAPDSIEKLNEAIAATATKDNSTVKKTEGEPEQKVDLVAQVTEAVQKGLEPIDARLKTLESSKTPPKSVDGDQTATVKKSQNSIWAGLFESR